MSVHGLSSRSDTVEPVAHSGNSGKYGRLFPDLEALDISDPQVLADLGAAMDETAPGAVTGTHPTLPAGYTYLGQFIDHDITFDPTSLRETRVDPSSLRNFRTPALDLDSMYGGGPNAQPLLYQRRKNWLFMPGMTSPNPGTDDPSVPPSLIHDLPRTLHGFAVTADPRNDGHLIISQLHLAFLLFHNSVANWLEHDSRARSVPGETLFDKTRELVIRHYQWIVLEDFLPAMLDPRELQRVRKSGSMLTRMCASLGNEPFIPVEFSAAAFRFGHTLVRSEYDYNRVFNGATKRPATLASLFEISGGRGGGARVPISSDWIIDWRRFFNIDAKVVPGTTGLFDPYLTAGLTRLSLGPGAPTIDLAAQNLRRGNSLGLPSGQCVAKALDFTPLAPSAIAGSGPDGAVAARHGLDEKTPLWYYILKEAQLEAKGERLGPVGSRLVAEVVVGLLESDPTSFVSCDREWKPTLAGTSAGFTIADLLRFVGDVNPVG